jgi:hypothetical protein
MTQKLQNSIDNGYTVEIGNYFSRGYDIMKQNMGCYIGFALLGGLISVVANFIPLASLLITPFLMFGFHLVSHAISAKRIIPPFGTFFEGFSHYSKILVISLLMFIIYLVIFIPFILTVGGGIFWQVLTLSGKEQVDAASTMVAGMAGSFAIVLIITIIAITYIVVNLMFSSLIAVFHKIDPIEAMKLSWKVINKNWLMWFVFVLAATILLFIGALFCLVGLIFAIPLYQCALYVAFEDVCGVPETDGDHQDEISMIGAELS